jgi:hypothetical protein
VGSVALLPNHRSDRVDDAYRRGVLRQVGAEYQFRHARLQDYLSAPRDLLDELKNTGRDKTA